MKKSLRLFNTLLVVMGMVLLTAPANAAVRTASASGNWNNVATWGGASFPVAGDDVFINPGVTVTVNVASACNSITFTAGTTGSTLTFGAGQTLTVAGAVIVNGTTVTTGTQPTLITVGTGTFSCGSLSLSPIAGNFGSTNRRCEVTASTGTITVGGNISASGDIVGAGGGTGITFTGAGTLNVGGNFYSSPNIGDFTESTSTVNYNGTAAQTVLAHTYANLTISGSDTKTLSGATTVNTTLSLAGGTLAAGTNLTMGGGGTPTITRSGGDMTGTPQTGNDYNVIYTGNSKTTGTELAGTGLASVTINLTAGQTVTLDQNRTPDANLTLTAGSFDLATFTINRSAAGGTMTLSSGSRLVIGGANFPTNYNTHSINVASTIEYNGGAQTVASLNSAQAYGILILSGNGAKNFPAAAGRTVNGTLSMQGTATATGSSPTYGGSAILEYMGSAAQITGNTEFPTTVNVDLVINNANGVTLNGQKTLSGSLTLTNGELVTTTTNLLIMPDGFATVNGGSTASYVSGPVRKVGNDAFTFPVGKAGVYSPVTISARNNNGDIFQAEYRRESATALGPINAAISSSIYHVSNCEYWDLDEIVDAGTANTINITMGWYSNSGCGPVTYVTDYTQLRLVHFDDVTTNTWNTFGGTPTGSNTTGTITLNGVTTFSPFALGSAVLTGNPLPVKFSDVKAFEKGTGVQIEWTNQTEENIANYIVERSSNGVDFSVVVSTVAARSNMSDKQSYVAYDAAPLNGANFYRVRAIEFDGKQVYSKSLKVEIGRSPKGITLYPNPVVGKEMSIGFSGVKGQYNLRVFNAAGQEVYGQRISHQGGNVTQTVTLPSSVKPGVYNLLISGDNYKESKMFVLQ